MASFHCRLKLASAVCALTASCSCWYTAIAMAGGVVLSAGPHPQYGLLVELDHGNGLVTRYAHTSQGVLREAHHVLRQRTRRR